MATGMHGQGAAPRVNDDTVVYAIGDMHGRADLVAEIHRLIAADAARRAERRKLVVYLGDYIDRGPQSRQLIDLLVNQPLAGFDAIHLKGNHEDFMLRFLDGEMEMGLGWLMNGALETLASYGVAPPAFVAASEMEDLRRRLADRLPASQRAFLDGLKLMHVEGDYVFVHAGILPGLPLDQQAEAELLWIREEFLDWTGRHDKVVVHGHSISRRPEIKANRIGIDTGAFATGVLTCLALAGDRQELIQTRG